MRVVQVKHESNFHGKIGTAVNILNQTGKIGVRLSTSHMAYIDGGTLIPINADDAVKDGDDLQESFIRILGTDKNCYINEDNIGKCYPVQNVTKGGLVVKTDDHIHGNAYFVTYPNLEVCPPYIKDAWVFNSYAKVEKKSMLVFSDYTDGCVIWQDVDSEEQYRDDLIADNITDILDISRGNMQQKTVEVIR